MWNEIANTRDVLSFMERVQHFHDSCIKELKYVSGAYVAEDLSMYPVNDQRVLRVIVQRQFEDLSMLELEFTGLKYMKLFPTDVRYTCEILDSAMLIKDGYIYWCDSADITKSELENYKGTLICAEKLRWRAIPSNMGNAEFFTAQENM